jgi:hypothetical protein
MKKIVLLPKTDTVILCLPEQWVGIPVICKLTPMPDYCMNIDELEMETEKIMAFRNKKRKKQRK